MLQSLKAWMSRAGWGSHRRLGILHTAAERAFDPHTAAIHTQSLGQLSQNTPLCKLPYTTPTGLMAAMKLLPHFAPWLPFANNPCFEGLH